MAYEPKRVFLRNKKGTPYIESSDAGAPTVHLISLSSEPIPLGQLP